MTHEQQQVKNWMQKFGQDTPEKPCIPSHEVRMLRAKLILKKARETIEALGFQISLDSKYLNMEVVFDKSVELNVVSRFDPNLIAIADGCEDLKVVTEGTLIACGLVKAGNQDDSHNPHTNEDPLFTEVMRSNNSKMWSGEELIADQAARCSTLKFSEHAKGTFEVATNKYVVKDSSGKVIKSPSYSPANLTPIIEAMSK